MLWHFSAYDIWPPWVIAELNKLVFSFFWSGKRDLVAHSSSRLLVVSIGPLPGVLSFSFRLTAVCLTSIGKLLMGPVHRDASLFLRLFHFYLLLLRLPLRVSRAPLLLLSLGPEWFCLDWDPAFEGFPSGPLY